MNQKYCTIPTIDTIAPAIQPRLAAIDTIMRATKYGQHQSQSWRNHPLIDALPPNDRHFCQRLYKDFFYHHHAWRHIINIYAHSKQRYKKQNILIFIAALAIQEHYLYHTKDYAIIHSYMAIADIYKLGKQKKILRAILAAILRDTPALPTICAPVPDIWHHHVPANIMAICYQQWANHYLDYYIMDATLCQQLSQQYNSISWHKNHLRIRDKSVNIAIIEAATHGQYWLQNISAQYAALLLKPTHNDVILDVAAAPGGKTMLLSHHGASVTAIDVNQPRLDIMAQNLSRTNIKATTICADFLELPTPKTPLYNKILLDAPCSAFGTIRKNPERAFLAMKAASITPNIAVGKALSDMQESMLRHAWHFLQAEGIIIYAVCTFLPDEGYNIIKRLCDEGLYNAMPITPHDLNIPIDKSHISPLGITLYPHNANDDGGVDGFFISRLQKKTYSSTYS